MAPTEKVQGTVRSGKFNKNAARRVRVAGLVPAVVYGAGQESVAITLDPKVITKILNSEAGHNTIFDLAVEGAAATKAMIVDWQYEPIKGSLLHVDLKRISMNKAMTVSVPVMLEGIPTGVKNEGGVLEQILREVEIECLPANIPSHIDVDVTDLKLHGAITVADLPHGGKYKFLLAEDTMVAHVTEIKELDLPEPAADATAEGAEAAPAAAATTEK